MSRSLVAAIQLNSGENPERNLAAAAGCLGEAAEKGAQLAALPENFGLMPGRDSDRRAVAEVPGEGPVQEFLARQARELGIWIIGGTIALRSPDADRLYNSSLVYDSSGRRVARYDKIHLFDIDLENGESYRESETIRPGERPVLVEAPPGRIGLSVCYDLRFPALYGYYSARGAELFSVPAAFTETTGRVHWEILLRARAIENLAYVIAPAQGGTHPAGRRTWGHAMIVDPWGEILAVREEAGPGMVVAEVDTRRVAELRRSLPVIEHRRRMPPGDDSGGGGL